MLRLICSWHCSHRDWGCLLVLPPHTSNVAWEWTCACRSRCAALLRKCERLQIAGSRKGLAWKAVAQPHVPMALLAQRHRDWGCLLVLPPHISNIAWKWGVCLPESFRSPAAKLRRSADSWQAEGAILESCCSSSSAHGTARTEAQRLWLLAFLATSNFSRSLGLERVPARLLTQPCSDNANVCR